MCIRFPGLARKLVSIKLSAIGLEAKAHLQGILDAISSVLLGDERPS